MYELYPYFTNDGTVGLFSPTDDDIYHSTYGALSESWQKFIIPSRLEEYLQYHNSVKILDICYGIGYNTKTALQVFIDKILNNEKEFKKNDVVKSLDIAAIDTDNIITFFNSDLLKKCENFEELLKEDAHCNCAIGGDNILTGKVVDEAIKNKILIDAIDVDKILMGISPFINRGVNNSNKFNKYLKQKYFSTEGKKKLLQIKCMSKSKLKPINKKFKLSKEVHIIILEKLFEQSKKNSTAIDFKMLPQILNNKKFKPFFSKYMLSLANIHPNRGYNLTHKANKLVFLHNIYYQYLSKRNKMAKKLIENNEFDINFHAQDVRSFVKTTQNSYNFIFLDAFTPSKCPCLWTLDFFRELYSKLDNYGMILTYSNSAAIRNAFIQNGFFVGKIYDEQSKKYMGTIATKCEFLIEHKLDSRDIDLINSRAGICYRDENLDLSNSEIIAKRAKEVENSELISSSQVLKGYK